MTKKIILGVFFTVILVWILISQTDSNLIIDTIKKMPFWGISSGFLIYIAYYIFLTLRFDSLIHSKKTPFINLFGLTSVHNMLNNLLPVRSGELSYVYLLKKRFDLGGSEGVASLLVARMMDFIAIFSYFFLSSLLISHDGPSINLKLISLFFLLLLVISLIYFQKIFSITASFFERITILPERISQNIVDKLNNLSATIKLMSLEGAYSRCFLLTAVIWGTRYLMLYVIISAMGVDIIFWEVVFAATAMFIMVSLPIQGLAGFGTLETGWAAGFILVGLDKEVAISTGFAFHIILLAYTITLGFLGYFLMKLRFGDK